MDTNSKVHTFKSRALPSIDALFRTASWMVSDVNNAETLVQQTYSRAFSIWNEHEDPQNCRLFLLKIMMNIFETEYKNGSELQESINIKDYRGYYRIKPISLHEEYFDAALFSNITSADVEKAIRALPENFKVALILSWVENINYKDIAYILGIGQDIVKLRIFQGCRLMQMELHKIAEGESNLNQVI